ncbi:MAG: hypothetical protein HY938_06440 [Nitrosomonadales bacterium]|nr:hypothetical protein [Nitrosomonadales bacterium]
MIKSRRTSSCSFCLTRILPVITLLFPLNLLGADKPAPRPSKTAQQTTSPVPAEQQSDSYDFVDAPRNYVTEKIIGMASSMDRFFGGNRHYQESNQSVFKLDLTRMLGYGDNHKFELSGKMSLRLPGTEGRLRLWLATETENDINDSPTKDTHTHQSSDATTKKTSLAARYSSEEQQAWTFGTDAGIKLPINNPDPFARSWVGYAAPVNDWRMKSKETVYWYKSLGVGNTTQFDIERDMSGARLFRSSTSAMWLREKDNIDLVQSFSIYHTMNDRSAVIYQASAGWITNPVFRATDYVVLAFYRYRMHQKWLYLELSPQLHFPWEKDYRASPALSFRVEALFDETN